MHHHTSCEHCPLAAMPVRLEALRTLGPCALPAAWLALLLAASHIA